jgi:hypothetical protein
MDAKTVFSTDLHVKLHAAFWSEASRCAALRYAAEVKLEGTGCWRGAVTAAFPVGLSVLPTCQASRGEKEQQSSSH